MLGAGAYATLQHMKLLSHPAGPFVCRVCKLNKAAGGKSDDVQAILGKHLKAKCDFSVKTFG